MKQGIPNQGQENTLVLPVQGRQKPFVLEMT